MFGHIRNLNTENGFFENQLLQNKKNSTSYLMKRKSFGTLAAMERRTEFSLDMDEQDKLFNQQEDQARRVLDLKLDADKKRHNLSLKKVQNHKIV